MVIHHPRRLHEGINDRWPAKGKPRLFQILGNLRRQGREGRHLGHAGKVVLQWRATNIGPKPVGKPGFFLNFQIGAGGFDRAFNLAAMAHNAGVCQQTLHIFLTPTGNHLGVKPLERHAKGIAFLQNRDPRQPRLKAIQYQLFP